MGIQDSSRGLESAKSVRHPSAVSDDDGEDHGFNLGVGNVVEQGLGQRRQRRGCREGSVLCSTSVLGFSSRLCSSSPNVACAQFCEKLSLLSPTSC